MRKLFFDTTPNNLKITGDEHKHLSLVLRSKVNDEIIVCSGDGFDYIYKIDSILKNETVASLIDKKENFCEPSVSITLFNALLKGDKFESVVRACTELGVNNFVPFISEFISANKNSYKLERLQKIILEAAKQSGRGKLPNLSPIIEFDFLLKQLANFDLVVFLYEGDAGNDIKSYLREFFDSKKANGKEIKTVAIIIGSEGGFSLKEVEALKLSGATPLTLGKRILRADTACITAVSLVMYELEQMTF